MRSPAGKHRWGPNGESVKSLDTALGPRSGRVQDLGESHLGAAQKLRLGEFLSRVQFLT